MFNSRSDVVFTRIGSLFGLILGVYIYPYASVGTPLSPDMPQPMAMPIWRRGRSVDFTGKRRISARVRARASVIEPFWPV